MEASESRAGLDTMEKPERGGQFNGFVNACYRRLAPWEAYVLVGTANSELERVSRYGDLFLLAKYDTKSGGKRLADLLSFYLKEEH